MSQTEEDYAAAQAARRELVKEVEYYQEQDDLGRQIGQLITDVARHAVSLRDNMDQLSVRIQKRQSQEVVSEFLRHTRNDVHAIRLFLASIEKSTQFLKHYPSLGESTKFITSLARTTESVLENDHDVLADWKHARNAIDGFQTEFMKWAGITQRRFRELREINDEKIPELREQIGNLQGKIATRN